MTGPEHYKLAEHLARIAASQGAQLGQANATLAQAHALLALTAATVLGHTGHGYEEDPAWMTLITPPEKGKQA